ncbi:putative uncharacterized protein [Prevotella sp. CAG:924]|nr:putative uncharacterized protein [Prevotella sp. CAG:924]
MILNTGGRTDTVNYFSEWLLNRFAAGYAYSRNPFHPDVVNRIDLNPRTIDVVEFCSKNYRPILSRLHEITERFNCHFHYTITAYDKDIEPNVPGIDESIETLRDLSAQVGKEKIIWRYDPVLLTGKYTIERHLATFDYMARRIAPYVSRCLFSFVVWYKKLHLPELQPISGQQKELIAKGLGEMAAKRHLYIQTCGTKESYEQYGIHHSGCMTRAVYEHSLGLHFKKVAERGNRPGCRCMESRGLGDYNTCLNGCRYCYANYDHEKARENYRLHDPESPLMIGHLRPTDKIVPLLQESCLDRTPMLF